MFELGSFFYIKTTSTITSSKKIKSIKQAINISFLYIVITSNSIQNEGNIKLIRYY